MTLRPLQKWKKFSKHIITHVILAEMIQLSKICIRSMVCRATNRFVCLLYNKPYKDTFCRTTNRYSCNFFL